MEHGGLLCSGYVACCCVLQALVGVLKKETSAIFKAKSNPSVYVLACQLLLHALRDSYEWPDAVAKVGGRWVGSCLYC